MALIDVNLGKASIKCNRLSIVLEDPYLIIKARNLLTDSLKFSQWILTILTNVEMRLQNQRV